MPLIIQNRPLQMPRSIHEFIQNYPHYQVESRRIRSKTPINVDPKELYLYIHQMESACISADDPEIKMIGLDEMTTCCAAIIRHTGSLAMGAGHFDGSDTKDGLNRVIQGVVDLTSIWIAQNDLNEDEVARYDYEVYLIGGFDDPRNISKDVLMQLLEHLHHSRVSLKLKEACIFTTNTYYEDNIAYPCITGLICDVSSGGIHPASFSFQGPFEEIRRLRFSMRPPVTMHCVYNSMTKVLEIKPYDWNITNDTIQQLLGLNTNSFLHYWSTSPLAEKPNFVETTKNALRYLHEKRSTLFTGGRSYKFVKTNGEWILAGQ